MTEETIDGRGIGEGRGRREGALGFRHFRVNPNALENLSRTALFEDGSP